MMMRRHACVRINPSVEYWAQREQSRMATILNDDSVQPCFSMGVLILESHRITWKDMDTGRWRWMDISGRMQCRTFVPTNKRKIRCQSSGNKILILSREDTNLRRRRYVSYFRDL